ncbi:MAG TPA: DUF6777 domain-containing protein, partial [Candidatus Dormibacteraeota bacterium]|nr:DUF6777 domain-containing protein [Candidatus Dormibacteraeota bacterium]
MLAGVLLAVGLLGRGGGTAQAAGEIYLAPASSTGPNPFTASLMTPRATSLPPTPTAAPPQAPADAAPPDAGAATPPVAATGHGATISAGSAPATALTSVDGSVPQLYGGRMGAGRCDTRLLVRVLDGDGDRGRAWAVAEGIDAGALHDFVDQLVPADLLDDVRVTDWHHLDGHGVAVQVVLQRGTTVLVDHFGVPRVRCLSGDPLTLPDRVRRTARFVGEAWEEFRPGTLIVIVPAPRMLPTLVLLETGSGQPFGRPVGGGRSDIDTQTLVATQAELGVVVSVAPRQSPDAVQELRITPSGGPPGSTVLAFGAGWPAGDRVRIEPCVGGRPETCALRPDAAVFVVVDPDGTFKAVALTVPGDVRLSDYVEFYAQDLHDGHRERTFDSPWRVAAAECRDDCGAAAGCHPPYCDPGGHHGCRCVVRTDPVCQFESCDQCPRDRCVERLRQEPTATPRPSSSPTSRSSTGPGTRSSSSSSTAGQGAQGGQTTRTPTTTTQATTAHSGSTTTTWQTTQSPAQTTHAQTTAQSSSTSHAPPPPPPTQSSTQSTRAQTTSQSSAQTTGHPAAPTPRPTPTQSPAPSQSQTGSSSTTHGPPPPPRGAATASPQPGR